MSSARCATNTNSTLYWCESWRGLPPYGLCKTGVAWSAKSMQCEGAKLK